MKSSSLVEKLSTTVHMVASSQLGNHQGRSPVTPYRLVLLNGVLSMQLLNHIISRRRTNLAITDY